MRQLIDRIAERVDERADVRAHGGYGARRRSHAVERAEMPDRRRHGHRPGDIERGVGFDVADLSVALPAYLDASRELALSQNAESREDRLRLRGRKRRQ